MPQSCTAISLVTSGGNPRRRDLSCRVSSNFVAQLVATSVQAPQTRPRRRLELRDAIRTYDDAVARCPLCLPNQKSALLSDISA